MSRTPPPARQTGFTLTELAIVLIIVGLLIGGMMVPLSATARHTKSERNSAATD